MQKYNGNSEPFLYGLFTKEDESEALKVLEDLSSRGYKLTYDEKKSENCIERAAAVLLFVSQKMIEDKKVYEEVSFASKINKTIISIFLEDTKLTPGLSMMLGQTQGIMKYQGEEQFKEKLYSSPSLAHMQVTDKQKEAAKKQSLFTGIAIGLAVLAAILFIVLKPFSSSSALLDQLGISGNLNSIEKVYVYGENVNDKYEIAQFILTADGLNDKILLNSMAYDIGSIEDISDFAKMSNLQELCISGNSIRTIEPILGLKKLRLLDISHNYGIDITGISALENLEVLNIAETEIEDISELKQLKNLKTLYVSADYLSMQAEMIKEFAFEVKSIDVAVYSYEELKNALNNSEVHSARIMADLTIPEGETITINSNVLLRGSPLKDDPEIVVDNYGTIIIYGGFEMGMCRRNNYGTIIVKDGGAYTGGMCDSITYGTFTIEKGGRQILERGQVFNIEDGEYTNNGKLMLRGGGEFHFNNGLFTNNGEIIWNLGDYGPGIFLSNENYINNGHIYYKDDRGTDFNPSAFPEEIGPEYTEIGIEEVNVYTGR
ncbi:MAG: leucine-rich repeat domain-containing protein [Erysipelotrichaceae bacterium]|nr:leucine-rich repeat domain-containing protein [Erysipelotrichaceae bacterium]